MRSRALLLLAFCLPALAGCGYHTVGSATHLPPGLKTLAIPLFTTQTNANHTEIALTDAVLREFAARTHFRVVPSDSPGSADADATLHGTILKQYSAPLTYNTTTQQSSSYLITLVVSVTIKDRDGHVLYENKNYTYREQYQTTSDLPTFIQEDPAAVARLSRHFASQLVSDVLESF
jgi:outer membrane lipopolysaccharide assembly protein LptE/RlpB